MFIRVHKTQQTQYFNVLYFYPKCKENELNKKWKDFTNGQTPSYTLYIQGAN